jgi:hypothetical protein
MVAALTNLGPGLRRDDVQGEVVQMTFPLCGVLVGACDGNSVIAGVFQPNPSSVRTIAGLLG